MSNGQSLWALVIFVGGFAIGAATPALRAQQTSCEANGAWHVESGRSAEGHNFYAVKFNRCTGEAWVLSAEGGVSDDRWIALPTDKTGAK
jgi:hypothetical protein